MYKIRLIDIMLVLGVFLGWRASDGWAAVAATLLVTILLGMKATTYILKKRRETDGSC